MILTKEGRRPLVTVLMPVRDGSNYIGEAIGSIQAQSWQDFELIIINDGSMDNTAATVGSVATSDPRVSFHSSKGQGIAAALETGRNMARGVYIARMDADDVALPDRLQKQIEFLDCHPNVLAVGGQVEYIDEKGATISRGRYPIDPKLCRDYLKLTTPHCHPAMLIRSDALQKAGGYRPLFELAEDLDLWLRLSEFGDLANLDVEVLRYRKHSQSITQLRSQACGRAACMARLAHEYGNSILPAIWKDSNYEWPAVEAALPLHLRSTARVYYLQALVLNGGIRAPVSWDLLVTSIPELIDWSRVRGRSHRLAYIIVRAAYQKVQWGELSRALHVFGLGLKHIPAQILRETIRSIRSLIAGRPLPFTGMSATSLPPEARRAR